MQFSLADSVMQKFSHLAVGSAVHLINAGNHLIDDDDNVYDNDNDDDDDDEKIASLASKSRLTVNCPG